MPEMLALLTDVFVFWYFAFAGAIVLVLLRDSEKIRGFLRHHHDPHGHMRPERVVAAGAPALILLLYVMQVVDGWSVAVDEKTLPDMPQVYLAILGSANTLYIARKMSA